jgi:hypothetical protein
MTAVRVDGSYSMFYVYDAHGTLIAVGDNAATPDPNAGAIGCGAGTQGFVIPTQCAYEWEAATGGAACTAGTVMPASVCH